MRMIEYTTPLCYIGEFIGTAILLFIGVSVCCNNNLNKSGMKSAGPVLICIGWGLAVMLPAIIFGAASGAHFNPALTIALAADGSFDWALVPGYLVCQFAGAFVGAVIAWLLFADHFDATDDPDVKKGVFCTAPTIRNIPRNMLVEIVGTFLLVFTIKGIGQFEYQSVVGSLFVFGLITGIGMAIGGLTGFAINPARDLGPRFAHSILPIKGKRDSDWKYAIVPLFGPIIGGLLAVGLFAIIPW